MLTDPRFTAEVEITVPFHDVDMMGVVWHGNYFRYFEIAREALLNQFDYGYRQMKASGYVWPVVDMRVKYRDAVTFEQRIRVRAHIEEVENRLRIAYQIFDAQTGKRTTTGYTIQAAVEAVNYYGGIVAGLSAIFATTHECMGYPVTSIFDPASLPDYASFDSRDCPMCKAGQHIDALVNSFGYSAL